MQKIEETETLLLSLVKRSADACRGTTSLAEKLQHISDLLSYGCTLERMLSGVFDSSTAAASAVADRQSQPVVGRGRGKDVDPRKPGSGVG